MLSLTEADIDHNALARLQYYSPRRFHTIFVQEMGQTPGAFLRDQRLHRACAAQLRTKRRS